MLPKFTVLTLNGRRVDTTSLNFEPITAHAGNVFLDDLLTFLVRFSGFIAQEAIIPKRLRLRASTTWLETLRIERVHLRVCWVEFGLEHRNRRW